MPGGGSGGGGLSSGLSDGWTEAQKEQALSELAAYPSGAVWHGLAVLRAEKRAEKKQAKQAKRETEMARNAFANATGAAKTLNRIARAHVAATRWAAALFFLLGAFGVQSLWTWGSPSDAEVIPVAKSLLAKGANQSGAKMNSATDFANNPGNEFREGTYKLTTISRGDLDSLEPGFKRNLTICEKNGICANASSQMPGLIGQFPALDLLRSKKLSLTAASAIVKAGAPALYRVYSTESSAWSLVASLFFGVIFWWISLMVLYSTIGAVSVDNAQAYWAPKVAAWAKKGLPSFERSEMLKAAKAGRAASREVEGEESRPVAQARSAHRL